MKRTAALLILVALLAIIAIPTANAATYTYQGADWGDWNTSSNWSPAGTPGPIDTAVVSGGRRLAVVYNDAAGAFLYLGGTTSTPSTGYARLYAGRTLNLTYDLNIAYADSANGAFSQLGGDMIVNRSLNLKTRPGTGSSAYYLYNGSLSTVNSLIGSAGKALFEQYDGSHSTSNLYVGAYNYALYGSNSGVTNYNLRQGTLNVSSNLYLGFYSQARGVLTMGTADTSGAINGTGNLFVKNATAAEGQGKLQGWGQVNLSGELTNNGQVIANSWSSGATDRTLDLSQNFTAVKNVDASNVADSGWYATDRGKLLLPTLAVATGSSSVNWGEDAADSDIDLVNSMRMSFDNVAGGSVSVALLASDHGELADTTGNIIGAWDADGSSFDFGAGSGNFTIKYDEALANSLGLDEAELKMYQFVNGSWVDITTSVDTVNNRIAADGVDSLSRFAVGTEIVPEPATMSLLMIGLAAAVVRRKKML